MAVSGSTVYFGLSSQVFFFFNSWMVSSFI